MDTTNRLYIPARSPPRSLEEDAKWVLALSQQHGLSAHSRFARTARDILDGPGPLILPDHPRLGEIYHGFKDITELRLIFDLLNPTPQDRALWTKIREVFKGEVLASAGSPMCPARDTQFELLSRAMLKSAGLEPTVPARTPGKQVDFVCQMPGFGRFCVEAKRPRSVESIVGVIEKAASQIADAGCPGFVLIDCSYAFNQGKIVLPFIPKDLQSIDRAKLGRYRHFWNTYGERIKCATDGKQVVGFTVFDSLVVQERMVSPGVSDWRVWMMRDNQWLPANVQRGAMLRDTFFMLIDHFGLPGPVHDSTK